MLNLKCFFGITKSLRRNLHRQKTHRMIGGEFMMIRDGNVLRQAASEIVEILAARQVRISDIDKVFEMAKEIVSFQPITESSLELFDKG